MKTRVSLKYLVNDCRSLCHVGKCNTNCTMLINHFPFIICLLSKIKLLTLENVERLPSQNLKDKQTKLIDNHHLNKNNEMKYLFHCQVFSFEHLLHVLFDILGCLRILGRYII